MSEEEVVDTDLRGGPIFVRVTEQHTVRDIVSQIWHLLGPVGELFQPECDSPDNERVDLTTILKEFDLAQEYYVDFNAVENIYAFSTTVGPQLGQYYCLLLSMLKGFFSDSPNNIPAMTAEEYLQQTLAFEHYWRGLCAHLDADYALFGGYEALYAHDFWSKGFAAAYLNPPDVQELVKAANDEFWLTYLGPRLASQVTDEMLAYLDQTRWKLLPSGAIFFRANRAPLTYNDEVYYELDL